MLQALAYWAARREAESLPRRGRFDPLDLPALLPRLQLHERNADQRFLCRLSGTAVVENLGRETTGKFLDETLPATEYASRAAIFSRALDEGRPLLYSGTLVVPDRDWKHFHRLLLPLANAAGLPTYVLSLLYFRRIEAVQPPSTATPHGIETIHTFSDAELDAIA